MRPNTIFVGQARAAPQFAAGIARNFKALGV